MLRSWPLSSTFLKMMLRRSLWRWRESKGLVKCSKKGLWRSRKTVCSLTRKGFELAEEAEKELMEIRRRVEEEAKREAEMIERAVGKLKRVWLYKTR